MLSKKILALTGLLYFTQLFSPNNSHAQELTELQLAQSLVSRMAEINNPPAFNNFKGYNMNFKEKDENGKFDSDGEGIFIKEATSTVGKYVHTLISLEEGVLKGENWTSGHYSPKASTVHYMNILSKSKIRKCLNRAHQKMDMSLTE